MLLSKIYVSITWRISLSNPLSRLVSAGANLQPYAPRLMAVGSTRVILKFGREGETCALRGHTAPLQTATATTYGPTSLYFLIIPHIVDLAHLSFFAISICFIPCSNISITFSLFTSLGLSI